MAWRLHARGMLINFMVWSNVIECYLLSPCNTRHLFKVVFESSPVLFAFWNWAIEQDITEFVF
jgi:hypothetical protein